MTLLELSVLSLKRIIEEDIPFRIVVKQISKENNLKNEDISNLSIVLGANLRHHLLAKKILEDEGLDVNDYFYSLLITDSLFSKRIAVTEFAKLRKEEENKIKELKNKYSDIVVINNLYKKDETHHHDFEYLSIRYNTPLWIIKMWNKHFSRLMPLILKNNTHESVTSLSINLRKITLDEILKDERFKETTYPDLVLYEGKNVRSLDIIKERKAYQLRQSERAVFDEFEIKDNDRILIYSEQNGNNVPIKITNLINRSNWVKYMTTSHEDYNKVKSYIKEEMIENVIPYRINRNDLEVCLLDDKNRIDYFFILPDSSNFDEIKHSPDYLIHFKQDSLDGLIANQKSLLEDSLKYLNDNGVIVYIIPTLSVKEGRSVINDFINRHNDVELVKDHQYFPFDKTQSSLYFAVMKKKEVNHD